MTISKPDYSNLKNAISLDNSIRERDTAVEAERQRASAYGYLSGTKKLIEGGMNLAQQVIETQDNAQKARLQPELEAKSAYYNQLLSESIKNGTTTIERDENGKFLKVNYAPEVLEYRATWLDDVNGRDGVSNRVKKWANDTMDGLYNTSDEVALLAIAQNDASLASSSMDEQVRTAAYQAANSGDESILADVIANLPVSDQYKEAYTQWAKPIYESETRTFTANNLATTEGIDAAYKYINSLEVDSATKDTLKNGAYNEWQRSNQALTQSVRQDMEAMLEADKSWTEIRETLKGKEGYTAYQRSLVDDLVTKRQTEVVTGICSPFVAQVQSGDMTVDELEDMRKTLQLNKGMFSGIEATYESYNSIISDAITSRKKYDDNLHKEELAEFKNLAQNYYDQWNNKEISGDEALSQIRAIAEANPENLDVVNAMNGFVKKIIDEKVPLAYRDYFNMKMGKFDSVYTNYNKNTLGGYQPMTDAQVGNYTQLYKDTVNYIQSHDNLTLEDIDKFMGDEMNSFFARYADEKELADAIASMGPAQQGQSVPKVWEQPIKDMVGSFDDIYMKKYGFKDKDAMSDEEYIRYMDNETYFKNALDNYVNANPWLTQKDLEAERNRLLETMDQPYAKEPNNVIWGVDTAGTQSESFISTLQSYAETEPFYYNLNPATGKMQFNWVNETAKDNWDNLGRYGLQSLREAGYDVSTFGVLQGGNYAYPQMVFYSSDGKQMYTINLNAPTSEGKPKVGDVLAVDVTESAYGPIFNLSEARAVTPEESVNAGLRRGAETPEGAPRNYVFDVDGAIGTPKATANASSNFVAQQTTMQSEEEAAKAKAEYEERSEMNRRFVEGKVSGLTSAQSAYASELEAMGIDYSQAQRLAPKVDEEIMRLRRQGVPQSELWETALNNLKIGRPAPNKKSLNQKVR